MAREKFDRSKPHVNVDTMGGDYACGDQTFLERKTDSRITWSSGMYFHFSA